MVIPDAVTDARVATLPPVASGGPHPDDDVALLAVRLPPQP
jgi:hypothetical protein